MSKQKSNEYKNLDINNSRIESGIMNNLSKLQNLQIRKGSMAHQDIKSFTNGSPTKFALKEKPIVITHFDAGLIQNSPVNSGTRNSKDSILGLNK